MSAIAVQPDGSVVLAGRFGSVEGSARTNLARLLPDGSLDPQWAPRIEWQNPQSFYGMSLSVLPDGSILLKGASSVDGQPDVGCGVRFAPDSETFATAWHQQSACPGHVVVGDDGWFYRAGDDSDPMSIRRGQWNSGALDPNWRAATTIRPTTMIYDGNGGIIVGDQLGIIRVVAATGESDPGWQAPVMQPSQTIEFAVDRVRDVLSVGYRSGRIAKLSLSTGAAVASWNSGFPSDALNAVLVDTNHDLLVGGTGRLVRLSGTTGKPLNDWPAMAGSCR